MSARTHLLIDRNATLLDPSPALSHMSLLRFECLATAREKCGIANGAISSLNTQFVPVVGAASLFALIAHAITALRNCRNWRGKIAICSLDRYSGGDRAMPLEIEDDADARLFQDPREGRRSGN